MYRYTLEPYSGPSSRYTCPQCHRRRMFSRYIDTQTNQHLADDIGRCSREDKCGYHCKPEKSRKSIVDRPWTMAEKKQGKSLPTSNYSPSTVDYELFRRSLNNYQHNSFVNWLIKLFGDDITAGLISKYLIGTSKHWPGATVFWQVDAKGSVRTGKIMLYGDDGKRVKKPFNHITWAHVVVRKSESRERPKEATGSIGNCPIIPKETPGNLPDFCPDSYRDRLSDFNLQQCLFGEHLLKEYPAAPVGIVESEKSAIIASVYWPQLVWLAAGSLSNLSADKCAVLKGRNITLFPDLNCFDKWQQKAKQIGLGFKTSALLEDNATENERLNGLDIADYLLRFNYRDFVVVSEKPKAESEKQEAKIKKYGDETADESYSFSKPQQIIDLIAGVFDYDVNRVQYRLEPVYRRPDWNSQIAELTAYFADAKLPSGPVRLDKCTTISDVSFFITNHLDMVNQNNGNARHKVYLERLFKMKDYLDAQALN